MPKNKIQVVLCRTCVRDNPQKGIFSDFENTAKIYKEKLREGFLKKAADLKFQNCFAQCENFHCVQVSRNGGGFLLKTISSPEKIENLIDWVKSSKDLPELKLPSSLSDHLLKEVQVTDKYSKA